MHPIKLSLNKKIKIQKVSCGHDFGFLTSSEGLLFACGTFNAHGQLGLGHTKPVANPELVQYFKEIKERVEQIECGYKHVIARTSLGKVFTWGSSKMG